MKKIIGIVLALCMLFTMASAATITDVVGPDEAVTPTEGEATMSVSITYAGLDSTAQATMLAYKVADTATITSIPAFVDTTTTPIVGIDQSAADGSFDFKVANTFRGKVAVMIGGTDVATPVAILVEFKDADAGDDTVEISFIWGDIDGDGTVSSSDGLAIINSTIGGEKTYKGYTIGVVVSDGVVYGDVDGDGTVSSSDGLAVINSTIGGEKTYKGYTIGTTATFNVPKEQ